MIFEVDAKSNLDSMVTEQTYLSELDSIVSLNMEDGFSHKFVWS